MGMPRLRWRHKKPRWGAEAYTLSRGGDWLAIVQKCKGGWFWYGAGVNTAGHPTDLQTAKDAAKKHILSQNNTHVSANAEHGVIINSEDSP